MPDPLALIPMLFRRATFPAPVTAFERRGFEVDRRRDAETGRPKIRCPQCQWQPKRTSRWYCAAMGAPEFFDGGCGKAWNTFDTGGKCPGCRYQWRYTSCLACGVASLHLDWYEGKPERPLD